MEAPGLAVEKQRLAAIGPGLFLGIVGDEFHSFGYHLPSPPVGDYSLLGAANRPVGQYACAIDISMRWPASRQWLAWLIAEIRDDRIQGIAEVIGSLDGRNVRYWSDASGWGPQGVAYEGTGHDTWTHVAVYRSTALADRKILSGWTATGYKGKGSAVSDQDFAPFGRAKPAGDREIGVMISDLWYQELGEDSPYAPGNPSARNSRLARMESKLDALAARVDKLAVAGVEVDALAAAVADLIARRLRE